MQGLASGMEVRDTLGYGNPRTSGGTSQVRARWCWRARHWASRRTQSRTSAQAQIRSSRSREEVRDGQVRVVGPFGCPTRPYSHATDGHYGTSTIVDRSLTHSHSLHPLYPLVCSAFAIILATGFHITAAFRLAHTYYLVNIPHAVDA